MDPENETERARASKAPLEGTDSDVAISFFMSNQFCFDFNISLTAIEKVMRIVEALEGKGFRVPLTKAEVELAEKLATIARQVTCFLICSSLPPLTLNYFANPTCGEIPVDFTFAVPIQTIHKEAGHLCPSKKIRQVHSSTRSVR